jgi:hypothetical protein
VGDNFFTAHNSPRVLGIYPTGKWEAAYVDESLNHGTDG